MTKHYIKYSLEEETFNRLDFLSRHLGHKSIADTSRMAVDFMLLFLQNSAMKAYFSDRTRFDNKAAQIFKEMYGIAIQDGEK